MSSRRRYLVLAICCMSLFIVGMDATIVNVALPSIGRDFHASVSGLQWTVDSYLLVIASLLMLSGSVADRVGRRMIFQIGLAVFTLGSLACSLAPSLGPRVAFRALQAVGGSMLNPVAMSIVTNTFTDPKERAKAIGFWGSTFGVSVAAGPGIGGGPGAPGGWRGRVLGEHPGRDRRDHLDRAVRAGVTRGDQAQARPGRADPGRAHAGDADLR